MNAYQTRRAKAWPTLQARAPTLPLAGQPLPKGSSVLQQYSRGIQVLPAETETVIAVSPINGDTNLLIDVLGQLERYNILEVTDGNIVVNGNNVIVFMPPYYAAPITGEKDNRSKNITLLSIFLEIEANNRNKVFVLAEHTATNVNVGEVFYEYRGDRKSKLLVNFMEPTYILDAGEQIILSGAANGEPALPSSKGVDGYPAWAKPSSADTPNGVVIRSLGETTPFELPANSGQQDGSTGCEYFRGYCKGKGPFTLISQQDTDQLGNTIRAHYFFAIRLGANDATRICEGAEISDTGEFISPIKFAPTKTEELRAPGAATTPIEFVDKDEPNKTVYYIRQPRIDNGVFEDWNNGRYTADEAAFLNSLDIFPTMLEEIFTGERWQTEVAFFLQSVSVSKCYTDDTLLLKRECEFNRNFLERIYDFFITEDLTVERRRQIKELATQDELDKYQEKLKDALIQDERTAKTLPKGDGIESVSRWQFHKNKKAFGTIIVYTIVDKTNTYTAANFMMINKATGLVSYHRIKVPTEQYDADNTIIQTKIQAIKDANSAFFVVY